MNVFVIGAGAAGLTAAIAAARQGARVTVLESRSRPGRKLLTTGNGRCNLSTLDPAYRKKYGSSDTESLCRFSEQVFAQHSPADTLAFFCSLGLHTRARDSYVYPAGGQSSCVLHALTRELERLHVTMRFDTCVRSVRPDPDTGRWLISTGEWTYTADRVIVACGSFAGETAEREKVQTLLSSLPGKQKPFLPALCALQVTDPFLPAAAGARTAAAVTLQIDADRAVSADTREGQCLSFREEGELQWRKDALSGIVIFQLSRYAARALQDKRRVMLFADLIPDLSGEQLSERFREYCRQTFSRCGTYPAVKELLEGYLPDSLTAYLLKREPDLCLPPLTAQSLEETCAKLSALLKSLSFRVTGTDSFARSQVCAGGISLDGIDPKTLECTDYPGLYAAGEVLDIEGPCGGYNLQWAWSSGYTAGVHAGSAKNT